MSAWLKLSTDILGDVKLMRAARKGAQALHLLPWILAFAKLAADEGRLTVNGEPADPEDIAAGIPCVAPAIVAQCLRELTAIQILVADPDGALRFGAWASRNAKPSDSKEAINERVTKHRARKPSPRQTAVETPPENTSVTPCNALQVLRRNATEVEGEVETEVEAETDPPTSARAREDDHERTPPDDRMAVLVGRLADPASAVAVRTFLAAAERHGTNPKFWIAEINGWLDGLNMPHLTPAGEIDVAQGLRDYLAQADPDFSPIHVRQFPPRAARARQRAEKREIPFARPMVDRDQQLAESAEIVQQILDLAEEHLVAGQSTKRSIRNTAVDQLGPEIAAAFRAMGGAARFLETPPAQRGLLHRDFAASLAAARRRLEQAPAMEAV